MIGLRTFLIHQYGEVSLEQLLWNTVHRTHLITITGNSYRAQERPLGRLRPSPASCPINRSASESARSRAGLKSIEGGSGSGTKAWMPPEPLIKNLQL